MESQIKKDVTVQGTEKVRVYKDEGVTQRASDIPNIYPIIFHGLTANQTKRFDFGDAIRRDYEVISIEPDISIDDTGAADNINDDREGYAATLIFWRVENDKPVNQQRFGLFLGKKDEQGVFLRPGQVLDLQSTHDLASVTFWCRPVFIEPEIVIPGAAA